VRNEFEMGENDPGRILEQRVLESAYTFHAYGRSTIGSRSDIEHVPMERLAAFYQKYYQPDNALLTVAGKFEEPTQDGERTVTLRRSGDHQEIMVVYHGPSGAHPDAAALDVLTAVLGASP